MLDVLIASFLIGSVGALVIVWLRWTGALPRLSSVVEIEQLEEEYKELTKSMGIKIKAGKEVVCDPEVTHSNNLRDDIWRQRKSSFAVSAVMYLILGGATAVLFVGIETNSLTELLDPQLITKLVTTGALWSTFYSFIDVKKVDEKIEKVRNKKDQENEENINDLTRSYEELLRKKDTIVKEAKEANEKAKEEANDVINGLVNKYNDLVDKYKKLKEIASTV